MASVIQALLLFVTIQRITANREFSQCLSSNSMVMINCGDITNGRIIIYQAYYELTQGECDGTPEPEGECKIWLLSTTTTFIDSCHMMEACDVGVQYPTGTFDCIDDDNTTAAIIYIQYDCLTIDATHGADETMIDPLEDVEESNTGIRLNMKTPNFPQYRSLDTYSECLIVLNQGTTTVRFDILELKYLSAQPYCMYLTLQQTRQTVCAETIRQVFPTITLQPTLPNGGAVNVSFQARDGYSSVRFWIIITALDESTNGQIGPGNMTVSCGTNIQPLPTPRFTTPTETTVTEIVSSYQPGDVREATSVPTTTEDSMDPIVLQNPVSDNMVVTYVVPLVLIVVFLIILVVVIICTKRYAAKNRTNSLQRPSNRARNENSYGKSKRDSVNTSPAAVTVIGPSTEHALSISDTNGSDRYNGTIPEVPEDTTDVATTTLGHDVGDNHSLNQELADKTTGVIEPESGYEIPRPSSSSAVDDATVYRQSTGVQKEMDMGVSAHSSVLYDDAAAVIKPSPKPRVNILTSQNEYYSYDKDAPTLTKNDHSGSHRPPVSDELEIMENDLYQITVFK